MSFRLKPALALAAASLAVLALAACGRSDTAEAPAGPDTKATTAAAPASFDLSGVPVSTAPLAAPPYFTAPAGYRVEAEGALQKTRFPIWLGSGFQTVDGDVHWMRIAAESGKTLSRTEVQAAFDGMVRDAGGVMIASGRIPRSAADAVPEEMRQDLLDALGDFTNSPTTTWVIRRADKTIWVHAVVSIEVAYLSTVDAPPFVSASSS
ncbi:MAG: hypothetical protein EBR82_12685 [Caulobacteraceae bacterium]|nr:hypothetical protein [Caulobacteraceae bacterium]